MQLCQVIASHKGFQITILPCSDTRALCDNQIMCFAHSVRHTQAIAREVALAADHMDSFPLLAVEGLDIGEWIAMDFGSLILHIFDVSSYAISDRSQMWQGLQTIDYP